MHQTTTSASHALAPDQLRQKLSIEQIKAFMPAYLELYLSDRIAYQTQERYTLRCPFHGEDSNPSCSADNHSGTWLFCCHTCGTAGSVIDLHAQFTGLEPMSPMNLDSLSKALNVKLVLGNSATTPRKKKSGASTTSVSKQLTESIWSELEGYLRPYHGKIATWRGELLQSSPHHFKNLESFTPHLLIRSLFKLRDLLWMGTVKETGRPFHERNFKIQAEWLRFDKLPPRLAAGTFKYKSVSRSKDSVLTSPYIVLESDTLIGYKPDSAEDRALNRCLSYGLIRYAQEQLGLTLRAVIDTSNKSLHAWFDRPNGAGMQALLDMAEGLRLDVNVLKNGASSPLRAPGCIHEEAQLPAYLLYLNPKY